MHQETDGRSEVPEPEETFEGSPLLTDELVEEISKAMGVAVTDTFHRDAGAQTVWQLDRGRFEMTLVRQNESQKHESAEDSEIYYSMRRFASSPDHDLTMHLSGVTSISIRISDPGYVRFRHNGEQAFLSIVVFADGSVDVAWQDRLA